MNVFIVLQNIMPAYEFYFYVKIFLTFWIQCLAVGMEMPWELNDICINTDADLHALVH